MFWCGKCSVLHREAETWWRRTEYLLVKWATNYLCKTLTLAIPNPLLGMSLIVLFRPLPMFHVLLGVRRKVVQIFCAILKYRKRSSICGVNSKLVGNGSILPSCCLNGRMKFSVHSFTFSLDFRSILFVVFIQNYLDIFIARIWFSQFSYRDKLQLTSPKEIWSNLLKNYAKKPKSGRRFVITFSWCHVVFLFVVSHPNRLVGSHCLNDLKLKSERWKSKWHDSALTWERGRRCQFLSANRLH